jgi:patatin-like phospholipase/acyl hydrolase
MADNLFRVLSLDGGGAKGFYTLGVLREIEGLIGCPLHERFDLIFGTSTGAIIAALLALGYPVREINALYEKHVPEIMRRKRAGSRSAALEKLSKEVFGDRKFDAVKTNVGIVTTKWIIERPMIFKGNKEQAHGRVGTFVPGFGCTIGDAVVASCSSYPFFQRKTVRIANGDDVELVDGGFCANNPTLYAIADALISMNTPPERVRVVSVGVGEYPPPQKRVYHTEWWFKKIPILVPLLQKVMEINTQSMDQLTTILFKQIPTIRINDGFTEPKMATDLFEHNLSKLNILRTRGSESFAKNELRLKEFLL